MQWDRAAAIVAVVAGLLALLLGWLGVSDQTLPAAQIPYLASGGLLGVFALGIAATLWLSADLRDEWRKLDDIHQAIVRGEHHPSPNGAVGTGIGYEEANPHTPTEDGPRRRQDPLRAQEV